MDNNGDDQYNWKHILQKFLNDTSALESSSGQNTNHAVIESPQSIHSGDAAIGVFGMMPNTVKEYIHRQDLKGKHSPELSDLYKMDNSSLEDALSNRPDLQQQIAEGIAKRLYEKTGGDETKMHYLYTNGSNLNPEDITKKKLNKSPYIQRFQKIKSIVEK